MISTTADDGPADQLGQPLDHLLVELDDVGFQADQHVQRGVPGAQVVEGHLAPALPVVGEDLLQVVEVVDLLALGHLEDELVEPQPGLLGRPFRRGHAHLRAVDRRGQEVDEQQDVAQPAGRAT